MELTTYGEIATALIAMLSLLGLFWRYFIYPFYKFIKKLRINSYEMLKMLPILFAIYQRWPLPSGAGSLISDIEMLHKQMEHTYFLLYASQDRETTPLYECDLTGSCTYANESLCDLFGLTREEMKGYGWLNGIADEDRIRVYETWTISVKNKLPYQCEYKLQSGRRVSTSAIIIKDESDNILGYQGFLFGIDG